MFSVKHIVQVLALFIFSENGTVILNAMTVAVINENCCYRDPLGVFRTVSVEWDVSWKSISYGEILMGGVSDFLDAASSRMMLGRSSSHGGVSDT